ncbi:MAG: PAS domain S-box protein [Desulfobacula sp.]|nr:PAS domain S-box protein [Desulfobacula sp.]
MPHKPTYKELEKRIQELERIEYWCNPSKAASKANIDTVMETIFKVAPIGIGVVKDRIVFEANDFLCRMIGYPREALIGQSSRILYPSDEDYDFVGKEKYRQIREKGVGTVETRFISRDRGTVNILLNSMPLDATDLSAGVIFTALDITESKQTEKALRESEERLKIAGKASYDLIYEWNTANDALEWFGDIDGLLGYEKGEILRNIAAWLGLMHEEDRPLLKTAVEFHRTETASIHYEYRLRHRDGTYRYFHDHGLPQLNEKGRPYKWLGVCTDITDRKRYEEDRKQKAAELENTNTALNILLKKRDKDKQEMEKKISANHDLIILPFLSKLRKSLSDNHQKQLLGILETGLKEILSPFAKKLSDPLIMLTPTEIQIASMIKQGLINKEIAQTLQCSIRTIDTHRANIRKKLALKNKKLNLRSYLLTF